MVTIHDVAKHAGVSIGTVSNVINQKNKVAADTAVRVMDAIRELNYIPNTAAKTLKTSQSRIVGILAEDVSAFSSGAIIDGICQYCESRDYSVNLCNLRINDKVHFGHSSMYAELEESEAFQKSVQKSVNLFATSQVDGLIYIGVHPRDVGNILPPLHIPVVYTYSYVGGEGCCVNYDDYQGAHLAVESLIRMGHKRIGLICGPIDSVSSHKRLMGYQNALMKHGLAFYPEYIRSGNWIYEDGYQNCQALLSLPIPPTAVFSMSDLMAYGAINAACDQGLRVPEDFSVQGFDDLEHSSLIRPALSTIHLPLREMGQKSAELMLRLLEHEPVAEEERRILLPCTLVSRNSVCGCTEKERESSMI